MQLGGGLICGDIGVNIGDKGYSGGGKGEKSRAEGHFERALALSSLGPVEFMFSGSPGISEGRHYPFGDHSREGGGGGPCASCSHPATTQRPSRAGRDRLALGWPQRSTPAGEQLSPIFHITWNERSGTEL